ncbi:hypothetical protein ACHAW6_015330 [Cyclotella cf. meneghiniana]
MFSPRIPFSRTFHSRRCRRSTTIMFGPRPSTPSLGSINARQLQQQNYSHNHAWHGRLLSRGMLDQTPGFEFFGVQRGLRHPPTLGRIYENSLMFRFSSQRSRQHIKRSNFHLRYLSTAPTNSGSSNNKLENTSESDSQWIEPIDLSKFKTHNHEPPPISKVLSILLPEYKWLSLAVGALTISTAATMQFPNAIAMMIDILNGVGVDGVDLVVGAVENAPNVADIYAAADEAGQVTQVADGPLSMQHQLQKQQMKSIALQMVGYFTVGAVCTTIHSAMFDSVGQKIGARLRKQLFTTIMHQDVAFFDQNRAGELANRLSTDVHEVAEHLVQNIAHFLTNLVRVITAIWSMIALSPLLTFYLSPVVPLLTGCAAFYGKFIKTWSKQHLDVLAHSTHVATERFSGIATVLSFGQKRKEVARYSSVIEAAYGYAKRVAIFQGAFFGSSQMVGNMALLGVLWVGTTHVFAGEMTPGQLAGFCMYAAILAEGVGEISESVGGFLKAQGSGARLFSLLDRDTSFDTSNAAADVIKSQHLQLSPNYKPTIEFQNVQFSYPSHPAVPILQEVSFSLTNGDFLALTGSSGSGKSSIISLLLRFYDPSRGSITIDGVDIKDLDVEWLRSQIGTVRQEPILFHASVFENVAYGKPDATKNEVIEACIAANAHHFILDLPNGYDTIVGERGASVSGGQKQRLSIARALLTKPRILLLDEASSALDAAGEQDILQRLRKLLESKDNNLSAILFVTHKKSVMKACDRVVILSDGRIIEKGSYDFLDKTKGDQLRKLMMGESSNLK